MSNDSKRRVVSARRNPLARPALERLERPAPLTAADVGTTVDGVRIQSAPMPGCYGCRGTGRLWWAGVAPVPCTCVWHTTDCEPGDRCTCQEAV